MKPKQKMLVQLSFTQLSARTDEIVERFYGRLRELDPSAAEVLRGSESHEREMKALGRKFFQALGLAVRHLDQPQEIASALAELGREHTRLGLGPERYELMREALLTTLDEVMGEELGADERLAWTETFERVAEGMAGLGETEPRPSGEAPAADA